MQVISCGLQDKNDEYRTVWHAQMCVCVCVFDSVSALPECLCANCTQCMCFGQPHKHHKNNFRNGSWNLKIYTCIVYVFISKCILKIRDINSKYNYGLLSVWQRVRFLYTLRKWVFILVRGLILIRYKKILVISIKHMSVHLYFYIHSSDLEFDNASIHTYTLYFWPNH